MSGSGDKLVESVDTVVPVTGVTFDTRHLS